MRIFKLIGVAALMAALTAIMATSASASILPGTAGVKITGSSGKATLQVKGGASITCKTSSSTGEVKSSEESLVLITFNECTTGGLPVNSVGDAAKTILVHVEAGTCHDAAGNQYILFLLLPLKLEVPSVKGLTLEITGDVNGKVTPAAKKAKEFTVEFKQKEGVQEVGPTECENSKKEKFTKHFLLTSTNGGTAVQSGQEALEGKLTFSAEQEFMS
jgi:hypothetical protein